jgi:hypothetical protein
VSKIFIIFPVKMAARQDIPGAKAIYEDLKKTSKHNDLRRTTPRLKFAAQH